MTENNAYPTTAWLVDTLGVDRAFDILDVFGNQRVFVPRFGARIKSEFMLALRDEERRCLIDRFGGETIVIPGSLTFCCQYLAFVRDVSTSVIARRYRMHRNSVQRALKRELPFPVNFSAAEPHSRPFVNERMAESAWDAINHSR